MFARLIFCFILLPSWSWVESGSIARPVMDRDSHSADPRKTRQQYQPGPKSRPHPYSFVKSLRSRSWRFDAKRSSWTGASLTNSIDIDTAEAQFPRFVTCKDPCIDIKNATSSIFLSHSIPRVLLLALFFFGSAVIRCLAGFTVSYLVAMFLAQPILAISLVEKEQLLKFGWLHNLIELVQHRGPVQFLFGEPKTVWRLSKLPICASISIAFMDSVRDLMSQVESKTKRRRKVFELLGSSALVLLLVSVVSNIYTGEHVELSLPSGTRDVGVVIVATWIVLYKLALELLSLSVSGQHLLPYLRLSTYSVVIVMALAANQCYPHVLSGLGLQRAAAPSAIAIQDAIMVLLYTVAFHSLYSRLNYALPLPLGRDF